MTASTTATIVAHLACIWLAVALLSYQSLVAVPPGFDDCSGSGQFCERRALHVTRELSTRFPRRHVSHMDLEGATEYLYGVLSDLAIQRNDKGNGTGHAEVNVFVEHVSGANGRQEAFGFEIANVYNNLSNVVLTITPPNAGGNDGSEVSEVSGVSDGRTRLLVNAHYDSTLGSPGASDCASCVGVGVEVARALLHREDVRTNAVFLFNGGEETLMQAAHGFMQWSPAAKDVGSFINIESTGPWGPDVLFQHQGWALDVYARSTPRPRGNSVAQDFFELGVIPADTDYRVLRQGANDGRIPGIDVAFLFDGLAYHTKEDTWDRIRPGTLQGMGENVLAAAIGFMERMDTGASASGASASGVDGAASWGKRVFVDIGARLMVVYPFWVARALHVAPLAFHAVSLAREPATRRAVPDVLTAVTLALVLPAFVGASRALVSGQPLSWYGSVPEACLVYLPAALAGMLAPLKAQTKREADASMQSFGFVFALVAFLFTAFGMTSSYVAASWAAAAALSALVDGGQGSPRLLSAAFVLPCYFGGGIAATTMFHVVEKIGIAGGADGPLGKTVADGVVGCVAGLSMLLFVGALAPWLALVLGRQKKVFCRLLVGTSTVAAMISTSHRVLTLEPKNGVPYTKKAPKRMIVQHILRVDQDGNISNRSISACSMDAIPVGSPGILPASISSLERETFDPRDWVSFYPLNFLVTGMTFRDPGDNAKGVVPTDDIPADDIPTDDAPTEPGARIPTLSKAPFLYSAADSLTRYVTDAYGAAKTAIAGVLTGVLAGRPSSPEQRVPTKRHYFELDTVSAGWAVLNITADIRAWSLGDEIASVRGHPRQHIVRYASGAFTHKWQFWIDVPRDDSSVHVELFVKHFDDLAPRVAAMVADFGDHVSPVGLTVWQRRYRFF